MPRLSITLTGKALEIYKGIKSYERSKWVSEAIEEKGQREKGRVFTEAEEQRIIEIIKEVIGK